MPEASSFDIKQITEPVASVDAFLAEIIEHRPMPENLRDAVQYALLGGGKRLRPILVIRSCQAVGGSLDDALPAAAALEMIHAFSLVHDDLPAMDDDDLRRGRATLHRHTSEPMAILAGDLLMGMAFETVSTRITPAKKAVAVCRELAVATNDMIAGQVYDTLPDFPDDLDDSEKLATTHAHKTGALIRAACRMGGLCGGAASGELNALTQYAKAAGLMFQAVDDLLDVTQSAEQMGKATGKDADHGKLTYPGLMGVEGTKTEIDRLLREAREAVDSLPSAADPLRELVDYMAVREK